MPSCQTLTCSVSSRMKAENRIIKTKINIYTAGFLCFSVACLCFDVLYIAMDTRNDTKYSASRAQHYMAVIMPVCQK